MKFAILLAIVALLGGAPVEARRRGKLSAISVDEHPIEKVVTLLQGLMSKVENEGREEEVTYAKFDKWCTDSKRTLSTAIKESEDSIESLTDSIDGKLEEEQLLDKQIKALADQIGKLQASGLAAQKIRGNMADIYSKVSGDVKATIKAIDDCLTQLTTSRATTDDFLFAQKMVGQIVPFVQAEATENQLSLLQSFADPEKRPEFKAAGDRDKHVKNYAFKSDKVIEILKDLRLKFQDEALAATKAETNSINAYDLAKGARDDEISKAGASKGTKVSVLGTTQADRAAMEGSRNTAKGNLKDDTGALERTDKACTVKKSEWSERSETRKRELEAMKSAIKILAKVGGVSTEAPSNPVPPQSPVQQSTGLIEISVDPKVRAVQLLRSSAAATHSSSLARLAQELSVMKEGSFDQVINMVEKMIFHLMDEQRDEDNHKNWCDEELNKTDVSKDNKEKKMAEIVAKIQKAEGQISLLARERDDANDMVAKITDHMAKATDIRKIGKIENAEAVKDATDAQEAIANAISVLEAFYKDTGKVKKEAWEFVQRGVDLPGSPSTWESGYTGVADPKDQPAGIITVLKFVDGDFAMMKGQTEAQEESDQKMYNEDMQASKIERAGRMQESEEKTAEIKRQVEKVASLKSSHKTVSTQHEAVEQYIKDLQHACVDGDSTYEDRKAARSKEIGALKEAEGLLTDAFKATTTVAPGTPGGGLTTVAPDTSGTLPPGGNFLQSRA